MTWLAIEDNVKEFHSKIMIFEYNLTSNGVFYTVTYTIRL